MRIRIGASTILCTLLFSLASLAQSRVKNGPKAIDSKAVKRGEYLARITGCDDCHTPWHFNKELNMPVPDMSRLLSGQPSQGPDPGGVVGEVGIGLIGPTFTSFKMPFGIVYAANLTPDRETGLGSWKDAG